MPEAAEVAIAARQLHELASGRVLHDLTITHPRTSRAQPASDLGRFVGRRVAAVRRHGKWILVEFDRSAATLGIHLRMSGQLLARDVDEAPTDRHVHAVLRFDGGPEAVWFRDPRTFGELRLLEDGAPVAPDLHSPSVTGAAFVAHSRRRRVGVKAVLLDQLGVVSGIGSYLADEALHRAGISPLAPAGELRDSAWERVLEASRSIALESESAGGVTLPDEGWIDLWGRAGRFAPYLRVHGRVTCAACAEPTRTATVGGRSARWCPRCQRSRRRA